MRLVKIIALAGALLIVALGFLNAREAVKSSPACGVATDRLGWKRLIYRQKHFLGKVETVVSLANISAKEAQKVLIQTPEGSPLQVSTAPVNVIEVQSSVDRLFGPPDFVGSQAWFSAGDAAALQRIRYRKGDDIWQNTYRFTEKGVYRLRKKPGHGHEKNLGPEHWTKIKESFYPYQGKHPGSQAVLEPTGLMYLASACAFTEQNGPRHLYVFDRKQLHEVAVYVSGRLGLEVSYFEQIQKKSIRKEGMIDALKISFKPRALAPRNKKSEDFSFMGLRGDFDIFIDAATGIPVQISGRVARIGKIDIRLQSLAF
jgi:hypothetical protein